MFSLSETLYVCAALHRPHANGAGRLPNPYQIRPFSKRSAAFSLPSSNIVAG